MFGALSKNININLETIEQLHEMGGKEKRKRKVLRICGAHWGCSESMWAIT